MLPAHARLRRREEFSQTLRAGRRAGRRTLVVHLDIVDDATSPRVGFVVSKAVGNAVTRHRVARRLRHLMRDRLAMTPAGSRLVVRALPAASRASSGQLGGHLDDALRQLLKPVNP